MRSVLPAHGKSDHRANGPDPIPVLVHLKVFRDGVAATVGTDAKRFTVTDDLGGTFLRSAHASVTAAGSGDTEIQLRNLTRSLWLLDPNTIIDSGDTTSYTSATPHKVDASEFDPPVNFVRRGDVIRVDIVTGSDATGLEVLLEFGPDKKYLTP